MFGPRAPLQLKDFQAQHHRKTLASALPGRHVFPVRKAQRWQVCDKARNASPDQRLELLRFLSVLLHWSSFWQRESQFSTTLYKCRSKRLLLPPKNFHLMCSMRGVGASQVVRQRVRNHVQWGNLITPAPLWYHSCMKILLCHSALPTAAWIQQFGCVLYTTCLWVIHKLLEVSSSASRSTAVYAFILLFSLSLGSILKKSWEAEGNVWAFQVLHLLEWVQSFIFCPKLSEIAEYFLDSCHV